LKGEIDMKTINFYKKEKLIFSVYAESLEDVLKSPLSYLQDYTKDMIITDVQYKYPIFINGKLREMTKYEMVENGIEVQLEAGEVIRNKKIVKIEKPQKNEKYLSWNKEKEQWEYDTEREQKDYFDIIDSLKATILEYGFDYKVDGKEHRQRCRDKDITLLASNITFMMAEKTVYGKEKTITWYFEDNFGLELDLQKSLVLASFGKTFTQSVYDTENYFKTEILPKELTKEEFEAKRKEIHIKLANM